MGKGAHTRQREKRALCEGVLAGGGTCDETTRGWSLTESLTRDGGWEHERMGAGHGEGACVRKRAQERVCELEGVLVEIKYWAVFWEGEREKTPWQKSATESGGREL